MSEEKLYRIKTKKGAHLNKKKNNDGTRAALQFDAENQLQGPVDLIEVDKSEYTIKEYIEVEKQGRSIGEALMEDAVTPAVQDALYYLMIRAAESGARSVGKWVKKKVIPSVKTKGGEIIDNAQRLHVAKNAKKAERSQMAVGPEQQTKISKPQIQLEDETVVHTQEEVNQILNNMKLAALYIAAGIRELSNTVVKDDGTNPEIALSIQTKLKELTTDDVKRSIDFMLEDKNRDMLDQATIRMFEAFRNKKIIAGDKVVSINRYLDKTV